MEEVRVANLPVLHLGLMTSKISVIIYFTYGVAVSELLSWQRTLTYRSLPLTSVILLRRAFVAWERRASVGSLVVFVFFVSLVLPSHMSNRGF